MVSAVESGLTRKVAQAHYCTGKHFLSKVWNHKMLDHKKGGGDRNDKIIEEYLM
ncbi:hypothetical protein ALC60_14407 [Trachymyrmex zeteki]|uniref:Uncharacterized protein n=1 Tax=Mycetomoellerius zeteki TaxID=64791 RepID=A0A151WFS9_9HYME|nr:hypothetical protein ALC60_14407 [Trachymyrmex zeteki]